MKDLKIRIPKNLTIFYENSILYFNGPLGSDKLFIPFFITITPNFLEIKNICSQNNYQLYLSLIQQYICGVLVGYRVYLEFRGLGYRVKIIKSQKSLELKLGFSHLIIKKIPNSIQVFSNKYNRLSIEGINKQKVFEFAFSIQSLRSPSIYKEKGIFFKNQKIILKQGKKAS